MLDYNFTSFSLQSQNEQKITIFGIIGAMKQVSIWGGLAVLIIISVFGLAQISNQPTQSASVLSQEVKIPAVTSSEVTMGTESAKVTLVEYSDFQCPACALYNPLVKQLLKDFDGKIFYVYRFFPLTQIHKNAELSSYAGYAAFLQGKFGPMQDLLFENQKTWAEDSNAKDIFVSYAKKLNLNVSKFEEDINSDGAKKIVLNEQTDANSFINSTPTFFLNGKRIQNPKSYDEFKQLVSSEIK